MSFFRKRDDTTASYGGVDDSSSKKSKRFTVGRVINASIAIDFFCILVAGLVVIGLFANLHRQLQNVPDHPEDVNVSHHYCVLYGTCDTVQPGESCVFHYSQSYVCEFCIYSTAVICGIALVFIVLCIIRAIMAFNIWVTVIAEVVVLSVCVILSFVVGVIISIGLRVTCDKLQEHYGSGGCDQAIPDVNGIMFYGWMNSAQGTAWFVFTFLVIALVIFIIRMVIFFRRRKKSPHEDREILTAEDHPPEDELAKPI